jgi:hypothetical protein
MNNSLPGKLHTFANRKARTLTRLPIMELSITDLDDPTIGELYPFINRHQRIVGCGINLNKEWFYANTGNPKKIKRVICHEVAHIKVPLSHDREFVRTARMLGAGSDSGEYVDVRL